MPRVLPLVNLIPDAFQRHPALDTHPVRIYPTPAVSDGVWETDLLRAQIYVNQHNHLIVFDYGDALAFIERIPDYVDRATAAAASG